MSRLAELSHMVGPGERPALLRLLDKLDALGVDIHFWREREEQLAAAESPLDLRDECYPSESARKQAEEFRALAEDCAREIAETLERKEVPDPSRLASALDSVELFDSDAKDDLGVRSLILAGDRMTETGATEKAIGLYNLALELAPTPQAQLETGFLIALRAEVQFPVPGWWRLSYAEPLVLTRSLDFEGLDSYQVIYDALKTAPQFPEPWRMTRLALEAYGRVYALFLRIVDEASEERLADRGDTWLQGLVIDGLHVLLSALDKGDLSLMWDASVEWEELAGWRLPTVVMMRLKAHEAYIAGQEAGREIERAVQQAIEVTRRTEVVTDPVGFAQAVADTVISRLRPPVEEMEDQLRRALESRMGAKWRSLPRKIRDQLLIAEYAFVYGESAAGRLGAILVYANAAERYIRVRLGARKLTLGEFAHNVIGGRMKLRPHCDASRLGSSLRTLSSIRNRFSHGDAEWRPPASEDVRGLRDLLIGDGNLLMDLVDCLPEPAK